MPSKKCPKGGNHTPGPWTPWRYAEGVTSGIMTRTKSCTKCDKLLKVGAKSV